MTRTGPDTPRRYWHERASGFSRFYEPSSAWSPASAVSRFLDSRTRILSEMLSVPEGATILDVGCGSGVHMQPLLGRGRRVLGIDRALDMLALARRRVGDGGAVAGADAGALPLRGGSFDIIISMGLLDYVDSAAGVLAECARVLKPGGTLVFSLPKRPSLFAFLRTRIGNRLKARLFDLPPVANVLDRHELESLVAGCGLERREVRSVWTTMWMVKAERPRL